MRNFLNWAAIATVVIADVLRQQPDAAAGGAAGINNTGARPDVGSDWPEGDLPAQAMGDFKTLMPAISTFQLPANLAQLWAPIVVEDTNPKSKTKGQKVERRALKFTREHPIVIVEGPNSGDVLTGTVSTAPRARGKKDNPATAWVSDAVYLYVNGLLGGKRPQPLRQAGSNEHPDQPLMDEINKFAGKTVRIRHGLSGQCRPDKVVRLEYGDPTDQTFAAENRPQRTLVLEDATGRKGCGARYYTRDFENPAATSLVDKYFTEVTCSGTFANAAGQQEECGAIVRGFPSIEEFLAPVGQ